MVDCVSGEQCEYDCGGGILSCKDLVFSEYQFGGCVVDGDCFDKCLHPL